MILRAHSFDYVEEQGIYRIDTAEELRQEKLAIERARKQVEDLAALELGMVTLRFANAEEVKDAMEQMLTERGNIDVDQRTNSLIINDIRERVAMISDMAVQLDTKTPQVEINARLVDLDSRATRELGVNWSVTIPNPVVWSMTRSSSIHWRRTFRSRIPPGRCRSVTWTTGEPRSPRSRPSKTKTRPR